MRVFSAPHLSSPCCLAEPVATWALEDLPKCYNKIYGDAARIVDELKRKIPKVCLRRSLSSYQIQTSKNLTIFRSSLYCIDRKLNVR